MLTWIASDSGGAHILLNAETMLAILVSAPLVLALSATPDLSTSAGEVHESRWRAAIAGGVGHAFGLLGVHLELRKNHWAAFAGFGAQGFAGPGVALGAKWFSGAGEGFVVSMHLDVNPRFGYASERFAAAALTFGGRARWSKLFLEAGVGPAVSFYRFSTDDEQKQARVWVTNIGFGAFGPYPDNGPLFPDISAALGYEF